MLVIGELEGSRDVTLADIPKFACRFWRNRTETLSKPVHWRYLKRRPSRYKPELLPAQLAVWNEAVNVW